MDDLGNPAPNAPSQVYVHERASASYSTDAPTNRINISDDNADNGLQAPCIKSGTPPNSGVSVSDKDELKNGSSGTIEITVNQSASITVTTNPNTLAMGGSAYGQLSALHSFSAIILDHAHPCNYRKTSGVANADASLHFEYLWDSTSGVLADLSNSTIREKVVYPGQAMPIISLPANPWKSGWNYPNPTYGNQVNGTVGHQPDDHFHGTFSTDLNGYWSFSGTQVYEFQCSICMASDEWQQIPGNSGTFTIFREVGNIPPFAGKWYRIMKDGVTGLLQLQP